MAIGYSSLEGTGIGDSKVSALGITTPAIWGGKRKSKRRKTRKSKRKARKSRRR